MENEKRLIDANKAWERANEVTFMGFRAEERKQHFLDLVSEILKFSAVDAIPVAKIEAYLQARLDEWNALGDRKWEAANMWGYNFIMACFDDLDRRGEESDK